MELSDDIFSARADGSVFAATVEIVPEPGGLLLLVIGLAAVTIGRTNLRRVDDFLL